MAQVVKNPLVIQETWVQPLGREDPLEEEMATHSSILAWIIPWWEEPGRLLLWGAKSWTQRSTDSHTVTHFYCPPLSIFDSFMLFSLCEWSRVHAVISVQKLKSYVFSSLSEGCSTYRYIYSDIPIRVPNPHGDSQIQLSASSHILASTCIICSFL